MLKINRKLSCVDVDTNMVFVIVIFLDVNCPKVVGILEPIFLLIR